MNAPAVSAGWECRADSDPPRALVIYVPLTTQNRQSKYEVLLSEAVILSCPPQDINSPHLCGRRLESTVRPVEPARPAECPSARPDKSRGPSR